MTSANQTAVAQDFFQKSYSGDVAGAVKLLDPKVSYHVPGTHKLAGEFEGPDAVAQHVKDLLAFTHDRIDIIQWEDWLVGVDHIAAVLHMRLQRPGARESERMIYLIKMSDDDRIRKIEIFFGDPDAAQRFFS